MKGLEKLKEKGYVHVYTGNGKGKTTAAFGLAVRALCVDKKVYIGQFIKDMKYNETKIVDYFEKVEIEQLGRGCFIVKQPEQKDIEYALKGLKRIEEILKDETYDVVILDEVTIAIYYKMLTTTNLINILKRREKHIEVVITGRYAEKELIDYADLVTEMKEIKHYYNDLGVLSRTGIDK